ncbi:MAG TPA: aldehyde dehydrogenase (NADP(+)), partial [Silvibacterium sp.]|nr:aldehyde dehydrogenase (NADP(+)) [Silvibacterium sp.]
MDVAQVLICGKWRAADFKKTFHAENPATGETLPRLFPVSEWSDCEAALSAATEAAERLRVAAPEQIAG